MGKVMELPAGSTPLDFAFKIHTNVGLKCVGAKVNGKMVPLDYKLQNGEIVEAVTNQNSKGPSADWLKIVQTNSAKTKIRQFLKKENRPENADRGKDMVEKAAKRKGIDTQLFLKTSFLLKAAKEQDFSTIDDLYDAISDGGPLLNKAVNLCIGYYNAEKAEEQERKEKEEEKKRSKKRVEHTGGVRIGGFNSVLIHYAKCCNPVPGDDIIGFTTKGNGVSIHRRDCINILSLPEADRGRLIDAEWEISEKTMRFDAGISLVAEDRKGLLSEISKICESMDADISGLNARSDRVGSVSVNLTVSISSSSDVEKLIAKFRQTPGVTEVFRSNF
jgi:GTP pyrophosphokinase